MKRLTTLLAALLLAGCSSTPEKPVDTGAQAEPVSEAEKQAGAGGGLPLKDGAGTGVEVIPIDQQEEGVTEAAPEGLAPDEMQAGEEGDLAYEPVIYFGFDSDVVSEQGRQIIKYYAERLLAQPEVRVRLEGHTDERGSPEYNLALGERRAKAVQEVMVLYGVEPERIEVVSYGESRPAVEGQGEAVWAKNRRVELVFIK